MSLSQIVYRSRYRAARNADRTRLDVLRAVLAASRRNNQRAGLTGFLLFDRDRFYQIIEGSRGPLLETYSRIQSDDRHGDVTLLAMRDISARGFPGWSMGGAARTLDHREIFLRHGIGETIDPDRILAPTLLALAIDLQDYETARSSPADIAA